MEEVEQKHKKNFEEWLNKNLKKNSSALSEVVYSQIVACLRTKEVNGDISSLYPSLIQRRVRSGKYFLVSFPEFGLADILCTRTQEEEASVRENRIFGSYRRVAVTENLFEIIQRVHREVMHSGQQKTYKKLKDMYSNIARDTVAAFISFCNVCCHKSIQKNTCRLKPIVTNGFMERLQIDLVDMQSKPDRGKKYICHVVDHFSNYHFVYALKTKQAEEVAYRLKERVLGYVGLPRILHSDNGAEFVNDIINALVVVWPGKTRLVRGAPGHSQSQGLVEQGNKTIQMMISAKENETRKSNWVDWLPDVQYAMNSTTVKHLKRSPYEIVFGQKPNHFFDDMRTNEKGEDFSTVNGENDPTAALFTGSGIDSDENSFQTADQVNQSLPLSDEHSSTVDNQKEDLTFLEKTDETDFRIKTTNIERSVDNFTRPTSPIREKIRIKVQQLKRKSRAKMCDKHSNKKRRKVREYGVGDVVGVLIPPNMRHATDSRRLPCRIISKSTGKQPLYKLLSNAGIISNRFSSASFMPCYDTIPDVNIAKKVTFRNAVVYFINNNTVFCHCRGKCDTKICKCKASKLLCTSKCHHFSNKNCCNKVLNIEKNKTHVEAATENSEITNSLQYPSFGGSISIGGEIVKFTNTCVVDTWLMFLKVVTQNYPFVMHEKTRKFFPEELFSLLLFVNSNRYNDAKLKIGLETSSSSFRPLYDFYGDEHNIFIQRYILPTLKHQLHSQCSNANCPNQLCVKDMENCPSLSVGDSEISAASFVSFIQDWFFAEKSTICSEQIEEEENNENEQQICYGNRSYKQRQFHARPFLLPVSVDIASASGKLSLSSIPEEIPLKDGVNTFELVGVSLWNSNHYTCKVKLSNQWYYYDGIPPCFRRQNLCYVNETFIPSHCLYVNKNFSGTQPFLHNQANGVTSQRSSKSCQEKESQQFQTRVNIAERPGAKFRDFARQVYASENDEKEPINEEEWLTFAEKNHELLKTLIEESRDSEKNKFLLFKKGGINLLANMNMMAQLYPEFSNEHENYLKRKINCPGFILFLKKHFPKKIPVSKDGIDMLTYIEMKMLTVWEKMTENEY